MFKKFTEQGWLERRLIWGNPEGGPKEPGAGEKPKEAIDAAQDKLDAKKIDEIAERVKNLSLKEAKIPIGDGKATPDAVSLKQALAKAIDPEKNPEMKALNVKNLDVFLMNGLLENIGKADAVPSKVGPVEGQALSKWMAEKKVAQFTIKEGYWYFFDKDGKAIADDYKLDDTDVKDETKPAEKVGAAKVEKAVLGSRVKEAQTRSKEEAKRKETEAKVEEDRLKPEKLAQVNSSEPVKLDPYMTIEDLAKPLELAITPKEGKAPITSAELQKALLTYINEANVTGKDDKQKFDSFIKQILAKGYTEISIKAGKFVFEGKGKESTSNPLNLSKVGADNKTIVREAWAHEKLQTNAEQQKVETEKKEAAAKAPKETPYDKTEQEVAKLLTGKDKIEEKDLANVDKRYLPALQQILAYTYNAEPVKVSIPFNDKPLDAQFYRAANGTYILKWGEGKKYYEYNPKDKSPNGLKEAQTHFAKVMNSGEMLRQIQSFNIEAKSNFEAWGMKIDEGPKKLGPGKVQYEFDWDTGALGDDPDVTITTLPHGELAVTVEQNSVSLEGKKDYSFVAGGFQDMIRVLKSLQKYVEASDAEKAKMKDEQTDKRFFEKGAAGLQMDAAGVDVGKIIKVDSVRASNSLSGSALESGYRLEFDWMQKLTPPQRLEIFRSGDKYRVNLEPSGQILGEVDKPIAANFRRAMELLSKQKQILTLKEGADNMTKDVQKLIDDYNKLDEQPGYKPGPYPKIEMAGGVKVVAMSEGIVYLSRGDGMAPRKFTLGRMDGGKLVPNPAGMEQAVREGYFLNKLDTAKQGEKKEAPPKPVEVSARSDNKEMDPPGSVDYKEKLAVVNGIAEKLSPAAKERVKPYLWAKLQMLSAPGEGDAKVKFIENAAWRELAKLAESKQVEPDANERKEILKKLSLKAVLDKFDANNAVEFAAVAELKNMPKVSMWLKGLMENGSVFDYDPNNPAGLEKAMAEYKKAVLAEVTAYIKANPKKANITWASYDSDAITKLDDVIKSPKTFLNEKYKQEQAKKDYEAYQAGLPLSQREAPPQPDQKISIETSGQIADNVPYYKEKVEVANQVLKPLAGTVNYELYRKFVLGAVAAESVSVTGADAIKKAYTEKMWQKLAGLAGVSVPEGKTYEDKDFQQKVYDKLKGKEVSQVLTDKLKVVPEKDGVLKDLLRSQSFIAGLLDSLDTVDYKALGVDDKNVAEAKATYKTELEASLKKIMADPAMKKKAGEITTGYDQRVVENLARLIKQPGKYMKDYADNLAKKKAYDEYNEAKSDVARKQKEYEEGKTNPHLMKFSEFKDKTMAGIGPDAYKAMAKTKGINLDDVFLARIEGNSPTSDKMVSFNAKAGKAPNQIPITINFFRKGGQLRVAAADGWNNDSKVNSRPLAGEDPVKDMVDYVVKMGTFDRINVPVPEEKKTDAPNAPDAAAKKEEPAKAPAAPKPDAAPKPPATPK